MSKITQVPEGSITQAELADDSVGTGEIIDGDVKSVDIGDGEVAMADLADMAQATTIGRERGAGTGVPKALDENMQSAILALVTGEPNGFVNTTDSTVTFNNVAPDRTLTIQPAAGSYDVWLQGIKTNKAGVETVQIGVGEGLHYVYFDGTTGTLTSTDTWSDALITDHALVRLVYWDATNLVSRLYEERHGHLWPGGVHEWAHDAFGARWTNGLDLGDILADESGGLDTHAQMSITGGRIVDEDLTTTIAGRAAPASTRVYYRDGAAGDWRWDAATNFPLKVGGTPLAAWNEFTGGVWQQTEVTNNQFCLTHVFASNDCDDAIAIIQGQADYQTAALARAGAEREISDLQLNGLPAAEMVAVASIIWQTRTSYGNAVQSRIRSTDGGDDYIDWRARTIASAGTALGPITNVDGNMWIDSYDGKNISGTWNPAALGTNRVQRRTAAAFTGRWGCSVNLPMRSTTDRGRMITSMDVVYTVTTAPVSDVFVDLKTRAIPADGVAMVNPVTMTGTWDANHDSAAKRAVDNGAGGIMYHTGTFTFTSPVYIDDLGLWLEWVVGDTGPGTGVVDVYGVMLYYTETLVP